jgi:hypothetical protein
VRRHAEGRTGLVHKVQLLGNVIDQGLSSLTNLLVTFSAAHLLTVTEFGAVGVTMATYFICVGIGRAVVGDPLLLSSADLEVPSRDTVDQTFAAAFGLGVLFTAGLVALQIVVGSGELIAALLVLGVGLPFLLLQDVARYIAFWRQAPWMAAANDLIWLVGSLGTLTVLRVRGDADPADVIACWVVSGGLASLVFMVHLRWRPRAHAGWAWMQENRRTIMPLLGDYGLIALVQQGVLYVITGLAGLRATAALRGAQVVLGPVNVLTAGVSVYLVQQARRSYDTTPTTFPFVMFTRSATVATGVMALCLCVYLVPDRLGELLLDDVWYSARPIVLPMAFVTATSAMNFGATTGLRVIGEAARSFRVRVVVAPAILTVVAVACATGGVLAAVVAQAVIGAVATSIWWATFVIAHRRRQLAED